MTEKTRLSLTRTAFTLGFTAMMCLTCFFSRPLPGGVPVTAQNFFAVLSALILGGTQGTGAVGLFLLLGAAGLPVFSGAKGGWEVFTGATGGYLWGYFLAALVSGLIAGSPHVFEKDFDIKNWIRIAAASLTGFALIYLTGVPWYIHFMAGEGNPCTLSQAVHMGITPFIPTDVIKFIISVPLASLLRPVAAKYLYPDDEKELEELIKSLRKRKDMMNRLTGKNRKGKN